MFVLLSSCRVLTLICSPQLKVQHLHVIHKSLGAPLLHASIKFRLSNQEALIQEVLVFCVLDRLTLIKSYVPRLVATTVVPPLLNIHGVDINMFPQ